MTWAKILTQRCCLTWKLSRRPLKIPAQLRMDLPASVEGPQQQSHPSRDSATVSITANRSTRHMPGPDSVHKDASLYGQEHRSGHVSGATTPSGPRSSASDESLHPGCHYSHSGRLQHGVCWAIAARGPVSNRLHCLAHSKSLPSWTALRA